MSTSTAKEAVKNYITPAGLQRLREDLRFLLTRERPAVMAVVAWAAGNGDRSENADYQYGKRRLRQIDLRIHFLWIACVVLGGTALGGRTIDPATRFIAPDLPR